MSTDIREARAVLTGLLQKILISGFRSAATERTEEIINCFSRQRYDSLPEYVLIDSSWCDDSGSQDSALSELTAWLKAQLALWTETYGKEFIIDPFDVRGLRLYGFIQGSEPLTYTFDYFPTSHGEQLDFRFELNMYIDNKNKPVSIININV